MRKASNISDDMSLPDDVDDDDNLDVDIDDLDIDGLDDM
eukprot:CAMPEP_0114659492 /NCGR_PEP_ID=MMETSP0191-20121206/17966_1 /TAXON_ID=126664 /ORGANISM="Sorites sp." /LENGTH=38 /DNA_ID= /DNA_START= /DNA_END= /DNA_ORIENTATION=